MLRNLSWLDIGQPFPPLKERSRIKRYIENEALFDGEHFGDVLRTRDEVYSNEGRTSVYEKCAEKISQVIGNFDEVVSFPVLMNYQRLMSLKMADLVCGEYPSITGSSNEENEQIREVRDYCDFDSQFYASVVDISRYGDAIWRIYLDDSGRKTFTGWDPKEWYPIVSQDGTNTVTAHVLCWRVNLTDTADCLPPDWRLFAQIHWCDAERVGTYEQREYILDNSGVNILSLVNSSTVSTGLDTCAVFHLKAFSTTNTVYGYDDYMPIDSLLAEIMARIGQISAILDKHADPNITGPVTMLTTDPITGERYLKPGKFFAVTQGDMLPEYMTWDGQLTAAFTQLDFLVHQLYILSEMGAALLGAEGAQGVAISGTALRFKMANPLSKARRIANFMTKSVKRLFSELTDSSVPYSNISISWSDGLPDDPRENIENCKLASGVEKMMPLELAIMEYFDRSNEEAVQWIEKIKEETEATMKMQQEAVNRPGPQDGTGVNPQKKGSSTGLNSFHSQTNQ